MHSPISFGSAILSIHSFVVLSGKNTGFWIEDKPVLCWNIESYRKHKKFRIQKGTSKLNKEQHLPPCLFYFVVQKNFQHQVFKILIPLVFHLILILLKYFFSHLQTLDLFRFNDHFYPCCTSTILTNENCKEQRKSKILNIHIGQYNWKCHSFNH